MTFMPYPEVEYVGPVCFVIKSWRPEHPGYFSVGGRTGNDEPVRFFDAETGDEMPEGAAVWYPALA